MFSALSKSSTTTLLALSELGLLLFGIILVAGLVGEYFADHKKKEYPHFKKRKRLFEVLVIVGVAGELIADGGIFAFGTHLQTIVDLEVAQLNKDAAIAKKEAGQANERAANIESNNQVLSLQVELLRSNNFVLQKESVLTQSNVVVLFLKNEQTSNAMLDKVIATSNSIPSRIRVLPNGTIIIR